MNKDIERKARKTLADLKHEFEELQRQEEEKGRRIEVELAKIEVDEANNEKAMNEAITAGEQEKFSALAAKREYYKNRRDFLIKSREKKPDVTSKLEAASRILDDFTNALKESPAEIVRKLYKEESELDTLRGDLQQSIRDMAFAFAPNENRFKTDHMYYANTKSRIINTLNAIAMEEFSAAMSAGK